MAEQIKNPEYVDLQKTRVAFTIVSSSGVESRAELTVPPNKERGINKYWDRIMDEFDIEEMRNRRNQLELDMRREAQHREEKLRAQDKLRQLQFLFDAKTKAFALPYVKNADMDIKSAIRRAPSVEILNVILADTTRKFMEEQEMDWNDYLDYIDDLAE